MLTLRELKEKDTIELSPDKIFDIGQWFLDKTEDITKIKIVEFFNEGIIKYIEPVNNATFYLYFKFIQKEKINLQSFIYNRNTYDFNLLVNINISYNGKRNIELVATNNKFSSAKKEDLDKYTEIIHGTELHFISVFSYIDYILKNREIYVKNIKSYLNPVSKDKAGGNSTRRVIELNGLKLLYKSTSTLGDYIKKNYQRHTESWGVRGHERKLKSGKIIFVKAYTKGEGKKSSKEYTIS